MNSRSPGPATAAPILAATLTALLLSACGGSSSEPTPKPPTYSIYISSIDAPAAIPANTVAVVKVFWAAAQDRPPRFPMKLVSTAVNCPSGITCNTGDVVIPNNSQPFLTGYKCGTTTKEFEIPYSFQIIDANGSKSKPFEKTFKCVPGK